MATFPTLKTGAVAQYPLRRGSQHATEVVQFVDGLEQRFRQYRAALRAWVIQFDALDETEAAEVEQFFEASGPNVTFAFTDPADGKIYPNCSIDQDECELTLDENMRASMKLVIRENRS